MKKLLICMLATTMLLSAVVLPVSAATGNNSSIMPLWTNTTSIDCLIAFQDGIGYAETAVTAKYSPKTIKVDIYVYVQSGSDWIYVTESHETKTGMGMVSSCPFEAQSGAYYKAEFYYTVSGNGVDEEITFTEYETA